ncbi:MAG: hypothetical protein RL065_1804 [Bacteroidota bacterium]|jgi:hypothetical protein
MLLQLQNNNPADLLKLMEFAEQHHLNLKVVDENANLSLPGKPLTPKELEQMIQSSRQSGIISMQSAHQIIRKNFNAD